MKVSNALQAVLLEADNRLFSVNIKQDLTVGISVRPVTRGGKAPLESFSPPLEKYVGHNLKVLGT